MKSKINNYNKKEQFKSGFAGLISNSQLYFMYFSYPDFLTPYSGLIQIRKYAEIHILVDLLDQFAKISALTKKMREELYRLLVEEAKYFG